MDNFDEKLTRMMESYIKSQREGFSDEKYKDEEFAKERLEQCGKVEQNMEEAKKIMVAFCSRNIVNRIAQSKGQIRHSMDNSYIANDSEEGLIFSQAEDLIEKYLRSDEIKAIYNGYNWGEEIKDEMIQKIYETCGYTDILPTTKEMQEAEEKIDDMKKNGASQEEISEAKEKLAKEKVSVGLDPNFSVKEGRQTVNGFPTVFNADIKSATVSMENLTKNALGGNNEITKADLENAEKIEINELNQENTKEGVSLDD